MAAVHPEVSQQAVVKAALVLLERMGLPPADLAAVPAVPAVPQADTDLRRVHPGRVSGREHRHPAGIRLVLEVEWSSPGLGLRLQVQWLSGSPPLMLHDKQTLDDLGVASYKAADDFVVTPTIGSMSTGLHPFLALWSVLLGLSSLARYEPAAWSKRIDIDKSTESHRGQCRRESPR